MKNAADLRAILDWMRETDLVEAAYKKEGRGFCLVTADPAAALAAAIPVSRFVPVASPGVGVFQWAPPGHARKAREGTDIGPDDVLGLVVAGPGPGRPVRAPCAGRLVQCFAEAGQAVEYGLPLFLVEPRG